MRIVEVEDLVVRYGHTTAVAGISFSADAEAVTVLLGPNGAGKTSTLECLEGYRRPDRGAVRVCGLDPGTDRAVLNRKVGVMLQSGGVYTSIRPAEALTLFAAYYDNPRPPRELLEFVGLEHRARTPWRNLSGGEQQRLSLALALVGRPEVAFLDEPSAGVDLAGKQLIRTLIRTLRDEGVAIMLTTHDLGEVEELADRIIIMDGGLIVADGSPAEILSGSGADTFSFRAVPGLDLAALTAALATAVTESEPGRYQVASPPTPESVAALTTWLAERDVLVGDIQAGRRRLEEVFLKLTTSEEPERGAPARRGRRRGSRSGA